MKSQKSGVLMFSLLVVAVAFIVSNTTEARTLIISDIDDTIKVSHVLDFSSKVNNSVDVTTPFTGMAQLYQLLVNQNPQDTKVIYLSNAPKTIAGVPLLAVSHSTFLSYNNFPAGDLDLRDDIFDPNHKITELRRILANERPDIVIMFGDNGERDAEIYHQAQSEFPNIKIASYIHQLYSYQVPFFIPNILAEIGKKIYQEQTGYVTPIEVAVDLKQKQILTQNSYNWMIQNIAPVIVKESRFKIYEHLHSLTFPSFVNCKDFVWRWKITPELNLIYDKLQKECS